MGFVEFSDGDAITITLRSGEQFNEEWCDDAVVIGDDGTPYFHFYIYREDDCTRTIPWDEVASIRRPTKP